MRPEHSEKIEALYLEMFTKLMAYARSILHNEALAEESVQETFRIACQKPADVCESANPQGWLVQTLKFTIRNMNSRQATAQKLLNAYLTTQVKGFSTWEDQVDLNILYGNIADTEELKLLIEAIIEGRSHLEMANSRGISVNACKKRVQRAKESLQRKLKI